MKDWKDILLEIKPLLPTVNLPHLKNKLPGDPKCKACGGKGKAFVSDCSGEVVDSNHCPECGTELFIELCPECSGAGYEPQ